MNYTEFAQNIKTKYPQYNDMDDLTLAKKMVDKYPQYKDIDFGETKKDVAWGAGRAIGDTVTFGQAPHLAGAGQAYGGIWYNLLHGKNPLKDIKKDYVEGREQYKKEQDKFKTLHPALNTTGEVVGALATVPVGSGVSKIPAIAKFLKNAGTLKKGALAGAGWGGAYGFGQGLSNTEGKAFDLPKALSSGLTGTVAGGTIGGAIPLSIMGVKGGIKAISNIPQKLKTGIQGDVIQYTVPNGVQTKAYKKLAQNPEIQKEAIRGDIGMRSEELQNKATEDTLTFIPEIFDKVSKEYDAIPKDTFMNFATEDTVKQLRNSVKDFKFENRFMPNAKAEKEAKNFVNNVLKVIENKNGGLGLTFENLKRAAKTAYDLEQKAYKNGDNALGGFYHNVRNMLKETRSQNKEIEKLTKKYADISNAKEMIENAMGVKFEKGANHRQVATKLIQQGRNRAGEQFDNALIKINDDLSKYPEFENVAKKLKTSIDLSQVAYDYRPPTDDKLLNRVSPSSHSLFKTLLWDIPKKALFETSPQEKAKLLAKNLKEGTIKPEDVLGKFDVINAGKFTTGLNRFLQNQRIYGSKNNPIAALMRRKTTNLPLPKLLLNDSSKFNSLIRNPLILELNNNRKNIVRSK